MSGQTAVINGASLGIAGAVILVSWIYGVTDIVRQPSWAWQRAGQSRIASLAEVVVLPVVGFAIYVFTARPKVAPITAAGRAAILPLDGLQLETAGAPAARARHRRRPAGAPPAFGSFGAAPTGTLGFSVVPPTGALHGRQLQQPITVAHAFTPPAPARTVVEEAPRPTAPAGWKADPTARHQFRYWDGFRWTGSVADSGVQSTDPVAS